MNWNGGCQLSRFYNDYTGDEDLLFMDQYLEHYGRKGMKWGQHLPDILQYLMGVGRYTGKSRRQAKSMRNRRQIGIKTRKLKAKRQAQIAQTRSKALEKARATAKANAPRRKELDKIVKTGSAADILKVANELSPKQRQVALDQLKFKSDIGRYKAEEIKASQAKVDSIFHNISNAAEASNKVLTAINTGSNIYKTLSGTKNSSQQNSQKLDQAEKYSDIVDQLGKQVAKESGKKSEGTQAMADAMLRWQQMSGSNNNSDNDKSNKKKDKKK